MGAITNIKLNANQKQTLSGGVNLGVPGGTVRGPHEVGKLIDTDHIRTEFNANILTHCDFTCPGCYIRRNNDFAGEDIKQIWELTQLFQQMDFYCEEIFIGPTDIFSAKNFDDIFLNPYMSNITKIFSLSVTSTLMTDSNEIARRMRIIEKHLEQAPARDMEIFVVVDLKKYLQRDVEYLTKFEKELRLFEKDIVYFIVNFSGTGMFDEISLVDLAKSLRKTYNVELRIAPSFFRIGNPRSLTIKARQFADMLTLQLAGNGISHDVPINMLNRYFGGYGFANFTFCNHELYVMPFLFEGIPQPHNIFKVSRANGKYTSTDISTKLTELTSHQYKYAMETEECFSCESLSSCVARKVLAYMETRGIKQCILPRKLLHDKYT